jgi:hypothetical protein
MDYYRYRKQGFCLQHLDYAAQQWNTLLKKDIDKLERVQHKATEIQNQKRFKL